MKKYLLLSIILLIISGCASHRNDSKVIIALSKGAGSEHYAQYSKWLESHDSDIKCVDMTYIKNTDIFEETLSQASGIVLTGGPDVHPGRYGKDYDTVRCYLDPVRDTLEFYLIEYARKNNIPVLGICRGMQILNVAYGGTLFVDIPEDYGTEVAHSSDSLYCYHEVDFNKGSRLYNISGVESDETNSYHHQGVDIPAKDFVVTARAKDGFAEAMEWKSNQDKPYLMAVQWHPERLDNKTSKQLAIDFINHCKEFANFRIVEK